MYMALGNPKFKDREVSKSNSQMVYEGIIVGIVKKDNREFPYNS